MSHAITQADIETFRRDGVLILRGVFRDWMDGIARGIDANMAAPSEFVSEYKEVVKQGRFFDDYCNWDRIPEFVDLVRNSPAAEIAARVMGSRTAQIFHDHVLVKEPGTPMKSPWHQDIPYYFVDGSQTVSIWIPCDPVDLATCPQFIAGSHLWEKLVLPVKWLDDSGFYADDGDYLPVPNPDAEPGKYDVKSWEMAPGDAILFDFRTVHGAPGNMSDRRRRAVSLRWVGDDVRYTDRPGRTSPPYPGHDMVAGQKLREDWFPVIWREGGVDAA